MQPGLPVVAEAELLRGAGGDRDDVLERAAQLDAQDVPVDVEPELAPPEPRLRSAPPAPRPPRPRPPRPAARGRSPAPGSGRTAPRSAAGSNAPASAMTSLIRRSVPRSRPLTTDRRSALAGTKGATAATVARRCADGTAKTTRSVAAARAAGSAVARIAGRQVDAGEARSFRPLCADPRRRLRGVAQQRHRLPRATIAGQRRAPGAGPDDRDARGLQVHRRIHARVRRRIPPGSVAGSTPGPGSGAPAGRSPAPPISPAWCATSVPSGASPGPARGRRAGSGVPSKPNASRSRFSR